MRSTRAFNVSRYSGGACVPGVCALVARQQLRVLVADESQVELLDVRGQTQRSGREVRRVVIAGGGGAGQAGAHPARRAAVAYALP